MAQTPCQDLKHKLEGDETKLLNEADCLCREGIETGQAFHHGHCGVLESQRLFPEAFFERKSYLLGLRVVHLFRSTCRYKWPWISLLGTPEVFPFTVGRVSNGVCTCQATLGRVSTRHGFVQSREVGECDSGGAAVWEGACFPPRSPPPPPFLPVEWGTPTRSPQIPSVATLGLGTYRKRVKVNS